MKDVARPVEIMDPDRINRLLLSVLPVTHSRNVLTELAAFWQESAGASAVFVSAVDAVAGRLCGCIVREDQPANHFEVCAADCAQWSPEGAFDALRQRDRAFELFSGTVSFDVLGEPVGGVLFFQVPAADVESSSTGDAAEISGRLIHQAFLQEHSAGIGFQQRLEAAKLESLAEFAAGAGHEINNPLASISGRVQLLLSGETDPARRQALTTIGGQAYRIRDMIGDLMLFARPPKPNPKQLNLPDVIRDTLNSHAESAAARACRFDFRSEKAVPIRADAVQLRIVVSNLVQNSINVLPGGGVVRVSAKTVTDETQRYAQFSISDSGPGLSEKDIAHLFDPFYAGRQAGRGLGFGLSKCWRIVSNHGGRIHAISAGDEETTFTVTWPADPETASSTDIVGVSSTPRS